MRILTIEKKQSRKNLTKHIKKLINLKENEKLILKEPSLNMIRELLLIKTNMKNLLMN